MRPEGDGCLMAGWFKVWAERRRDDAQGGRGDAEI